MNEVIELKIEILLETNNAIAIENLNGITVFIPKSQIEISEDEKSMIIPEWLAIQKELV